MKSVIPVTFPCNKHKINVLNNLFAVACNFLDEQTGNQTDFHNDLYHAKDSNDESKVSYMCVISAILFENCRNTG